MRCLSLGGGGECEAQQLCFYGLRAAEGGFEAFGCDTQFLPEILNEQLQALFQYHKQSVCVVLEGTKMCVCGETRCNAKWLEHELWRELSPGASLAQWISSMTLFFCTLGSLLFCVYCLAKHSLSPRQLRRSLLHPCTAKLFILVFSIVEELFLYVQVFLSWMPQRIVWSQVGVEKRISEGIYLLQIATPADSLSSVLYGYQYLPLFNMGLLAVALCSQLMPYSSGNVKPHVLTIAVCKGVFACLFLLLTFWMQKLVATFGTSLGENATLQITSWTLSAVSSYVYSGLCAISAIVLFARYHAGRHRDQRPSLHTVRRESLLSPHVEGADKSRASSHTILISPQPLVVHIKYGGVLTVENSFEFNWTSVRILLSSGELSVHPKKFLIPPGRKVDVSIRTFSLGAKGTRLLVEWFELGRECPRDIEFLWIRPFPVPREFWHHSTVRVDFDFESFGGDDRYGV